MIEYRDAIEWIALNDALATLDSTVDEATQEELLGKASVDMVADLWNKTRATVARDVIRFRRAFTERANDLG